MVGLFVVICCFVLFVVVSRLVICCFGPVDRYYCMLVVVFGFLFVWFCVCVCLVVGVVLCLGFWVGLWFAGFCFMLFRYFVVDGFGGLL